MDIRQEMGIVAGRGKSRSSRLRAEGDKKAKTSKGKPAAVKKNGAGLIEFDGDTTDECGQQITWHSLSVTSSLLSIITIFKFK